MAVLVELATLQQHLHLKETMVVVPFILHQIIIMAVVVAVAVPQV
jgi:hypothetical protein